MNYNFVDLVKFVVTKRKWLLNKMKATENCTDCDVAETEHRVYSTIECMMSDVVDQHEDVKNTLPTMLANASSRKGQLRLSSVLGILDACGFTVDYKEVVDLVKDRYGD